MISCDGWTITVNGSRLELMADLHAILYALDKKDVISLNTARKILDYTAVAEGDKASKGRAMRGITDALVDQERHERQKKGNDLYDKIKDLIFEGD